MMAGVASLFVCTYISGMLWHERKKLIVAILVITAVPVYAQAQSASVPRVSKEGAHKVVTIITGDKAKPQTYCDI